MGDRFNAKKEIENLAIITNNGFNTMFNLHKEQVIKAELLTKDVDLLKHSMAEINKKLDFILEHMVSRYEFQSLVLRTEKIEHVLNLK